jgi:toxin ParE1/3/4
VAEYVLSKKADNDLDGIYVYSVENFGEAQADEYFLGLCACLRTLADNPRVGREASWLNPGLRWHRHERHLIFYMIEGVDIFVVRLLHEAMDVARRLG